MALALTGGTPEREPIRRHPMQDAHHFNGVSMNGASE